MRKIIEQGVVTLDGQISTPQNWLGELWAGQFEQRSHDLLFSVDALLYGRVSYEQHAAVWPHLEEQFGDYAVRMNTIPKHVASTTLKEATAWNATLIEGDVVEEVAKLKEQPGGDVLKVGTGGPLSRTLLRHRLVDEYLFWLVPVIAGSGGRLYDGIDSTYLKLVDVDRLDNGVLGLRYVLK
ncbi:dihydrofolate reductase family protein [Nonomuraea sp. SYSU D8015]|uniref:dihydrofolate reductase family protein n=1 Tax=Nonomuraea sp. SYSU D8015 TaxID=2593644 RepID=UPI001661054E|nr:dihydrofolate reductase family protein [Nonomuraea sp. SYSU D8015]